jgi:hypothetical protein
MAANWLILFPDSKPDILEKYIADKKLAYAMRGAKKLMKTIRARVSEAKKEMGEQ